MVSPTRCVREALQTMQSKSLVELYRPNKVLAITDFRNSMRCEFEVEYKLRSTITRRFGKQGVKSHQLSTFEMPLREMREVETMKFDPVTGKKQKEKTTRVMEFARAESIKRLVSSEQGESWVHETKWVPLTRKMGVDMEKWEQSKLRSRGGNTHHRTMEEEPDDSRARDVRLMDDEDQWGSKFFWFLVHFHQLLKEGVTHELGMLGLLPGGLVTAGSVDEAIRSYDKCGNLVISLIEHKTVGYDPSTWDNPHSRTIHTGSRQAMLYKYFLDRMISRSPPFRWMELWRRVVVDPRRKFSETWRTRVATGTRRGATQETLQASCINDLVDIWNGLLSTYQPREVNHLILKLVPRGDSNERGPRAYQIAQTKSETGYLRASLEKTKEVEITYDESLVESMIKGGVEFWTGMRLPQGGPLYGLNDCRVCRFSPSCEWRNVRGSLNDNNRAEEEEVKS